MVFHENCLLADNSHEISYLSFFRKFGKMSQNLSSSAVVIGTLRVTSWLLLVVFIVFFFYFPMWYPGSSVLRDCIVS